MVPVETVLRVLALRLGEAVLVNLLKSPFCTTSKSLFCTSRVLVSWDIGLETVGVRDIILAEFGKRTGQTFRSQWDFVDWAAANRPGMDLISPYRPPTE